ncbi:hypothetical protein ACER0A_010085 [Haloimpatiens sp. FM7315]|uniref:hypothetical protein n=1 Tax=Haloimpatiens sp. FM7315 TaxID=3298609 RepID=UPI0035A2BDE3
MILNTKITFAIKSSESKYLIVETDMFKIKNLHDKIHFLNVKIKNKDIMFQIECPLCEKNHKYIYPINNFINKDLLIGGCETLNAPLFLLGKEKSVRKMVKLYENINSEIYDSTIK